MLYGENKFLGFFGATRCIKQSRSAEGYAGISVRKKKVGRKFETYLAFTHSMRHSCRLKAAEEKTVMLRSQEKQPKKRLASTMMNVPFASTKNLGHPSFLCSHIFCRACLQNWIQKTEEKNRNKTCRAPCVKNSTIWRASPLVRFWQNKAGFQALQNLRSSLTLKVCDGSFLS